MKPSRILAIPLVAAGFLHAQTAAICAETPIVALQMAALSAPNTSGKSLQKPVDSVASLVGAWRFTNPDNGWTGTRTFRENGTFTGEGFKGAGKWDLEADKVIVSYPDGTKDQMLLPIDPQNTITIIKRGKKISAFKEKTERSGQKTGDPATALIGAWRFTNPDSGWTGTRTFRENGTFTGEGFKGAGKWELASDKVIISYPNGSKDLMLLPIDPQNTLTIIKQGKKKISAFKE